MDLQRTPPKQVLINLGIALLIPVIHWIYGDGWNKDAQVPGDQWKGVLILVVLLLGLIGGTREILELKHMIRGQVAWFFLTLMATAAHIMLYMAALNYLGYDFSGQMSGGENTLLAIGGLLFTGYFLFELIYILAHETKEDIKPRRSYGWSDVLLSIYAAFGGVYIWDILLGDLGFEFQNPGYFLIAELFPAILLFLMLILPFKRYDLMEGHGVSRTRMEKTYLFLSYLLMVGAAIVPRIWESMGNG